jgi:hypothetical protein
MANNEKDTIYIDIDDEITGIIDKLRSSKGKIVALVLPKRATVLQSSVNMKLLKRASDDAKKHLVLITSEAGLLPLAGAASIHVAKSLTSKPEIPAGPLEVADTEDVEELPDEPEEITADNAGDTPVGELAGAAAVSQPRPSEDMETVELDNDEPDAGLAAAGAAAAATVAKKPKKDKKLAVPNFDRFRLLLVAGGAALLLLIIAFILASIILPKATIAIDTDATAVNADLNVNLSTTAKSVRLASGTIPAKLVKQQKTYTQQVSATGQQNNGNKASGSVTLTNCSGDDVTLPAGTGISSNSNTYITQETVTIHDSNYTSPFTGSKCKNDGKATVGVIAQKGGASYNQASGANFAVSASSACSSSCTSHLSGQGGTISGGTDNIVTVVSQNDINNAKSKINTNDDTIKQALQESLKKDNYYAIPATYTTSTPNVTTSSNAGDAASSVTVTEAVTDSMFGAQEADLKALVDNAVKEQIDTSKQSILSEGLDKAVFNVSSQTETGAEMSMHTVATAGPELNIDDLKQQVGGKKSGEVKSILQSNPDVTNVNVKLSPFWVTKVPKKHSKVTIVITKPKNTANAGNANNP